MQNNVVIRCVLLLLSLFILSSCNKEPEYKTVYLNAGLKAVFNNKPGSYWIYRDSVTGEVDSLYLVVNTLKIDDGYVSTHGVKYETMTLTYDSKHFGSDTSYSLFLGMNFDTKDDHYFICGLKKVTLQPLNFWFNYPISQMGAVHNKSDTILYSKMTTPLVLGAHTFNNVLVFYQSSRTDLSQNSIGFWTDTKGLIKMRFLCKSTSGPAIRVLELQRWKTVK